MVSADGGSIFSVEHSVGIMRYGRDGSFQEVLEPQVQTLGDLFLGDDGDGKG